MSLLIEDDYPEAVGPRDLSGSRRAREAPGQSRRRSRRAATARQRLVVEDELPDAVADDYYPEAASRRYYPEAARDAHPAEAGSDGYRPEAARGGYRPEAARDGYRPEAARGGYRPEAARGGYRPEAARDGYRPEPARDWDRPGVARDGYGPEAGSDTYPPEAARDWYRSEAARNAYRPAAARDPYRPEAARYANPPEAPQDWYRPEAGEQGYYREATEPSHPPADNWADYWHQDDRDTVAGDGHLPAMARESWTATPQRGPVGARPDDPSVRRRREGDRAPRQFVTTPQRLGGIVLAAASLLGVALYVPTILAADSRSFTGVVSNSGIASLNFAASGRVATVRVRLGQAVRPGQLLAAEAAPARGAAARADRAQIQADKANLAALVAHGAGTASIASAEAKLARDRAKRASDLMKLVATQILAPKPGTVVAIYGQPGETVTPAGLRGMGAQGRAALTRQPRFSLVPSGPMASVRSRGMALPVIALRTSGGWQVRLLIPQTSTSAVKVGQAVRISVPAAGLTGIRGTVEELSPVPVGTSGSADYLVTVAVQSRTPVTPLSGMTANIQLASLSPRTLHGRQGRTAGTS